MQTFNFHNNSSSKTPSQRVLPIISRLTQTYKLWYEIIQHIPKKSRFTLGSKIDFNFLEVMELIFIAGNLLKDKKLPYIQKAIGKFDMLKFLLQIAWEIKTLDDKKYVSISTPLDEIGRMLGGWHRNLLSADKETSAH